MLTSSTHSSATANLGNAFSKDPRCWGPHVGSFTTPCRAMGGIPTSVRWWTLHWVASDIARILLWVVREPMQLLKVIFPSVAKRMWSKPRDGFNQIAGTGFSTTPNLSNDLILEWNTTSCGSVCQRISIEVW